MLVEASEAGGRMSSGRLLHPSSCGIPLLLGEDEASGGDEASGTDATPGEKAAFLFLVALVSRATGCCCWSF